MQRKINNGEKEQQKEQQETEKETEQIIPKGSQANPYSDEGTASTSGMPIPDVPAQMAAQQNNANTLAQQQSHVLAQEINDTAMNAVKFDLGTANLMKGAVYGNIDIANITQGIRSAKALLNPDSNLVYYSFPQIPSVTWTVLDERKLMPILTKMPNLIQFLCFADVNGMTLLDVLGTVGYQKDDTACRQLFDPSMRYMFRALNLRMLDMMSNASSAATALQYEDNIGQYIGVGTDPKSIELALKEKSWVSVFNDVDITIENLKYYFGIYGRIISYLSNTSMVRSKKARYDYTSTDSFFTNTMRLKSYEGSEFFMHTPVILMNADYPNGPMITKVREFYENREPGENRYIRPQWIPDRVNAVGSKERYADAVVTTDHWTAAAIAIARLEDMQNLTTAEPFAEIQSLYGVTAVSASFRRNVSVPKADPARQRLRHVNALFYKQCLQSERSQIGTFTAEMAPNILVNQDRDIDSNVMATLDAIAASSRNSNQKLAQRVKSAMTQPIDLNQICQILTAEKLNLTSGLYFEFGPSTASFNTDDLMSFMQGLMLHNFTDSLASGSVASIYLFGMQLFKPIFGAAYGRLVWSSVPGHERVPMSRTLRVSTPVPEMMWNDQLNPNNPILREYNRLFVRDDARPDELLNIIQEQRLSFGRVFDYAKSPFCDEHPAWSQFGYRTPSDMPLRSVTTRLADIFTILLGLINRLILRDSKDEIIRVLNLMRDNVQVFENFFGCVLPNMRAMTAVFPVSLQKKIATVFDPRAAQAEWDNARIRLQEFNDPHDLEPHAHWRPWTNVEQLPMDGILDVKMLNLFSWMVKTDMKLDSMKMPQILAFVEDQIGVCEAMKIFQLGMTVMNNIALMPTVLQESIGNAKISLTKPAAFYKLLAGLMHSEVLTAPEDALYLKDPELLKAYYAYPQNATVAEVMRLGHDGMYHPAAYNCESDRDAANMILGRDMLDKHPVTFGLSNGYILASYRSVEEMDDSRAKAGEEIRYIESTSIQVGAISYSTLAQTTIVRLTQPVGPNDPIDYNVTEDIYLSELLERWQAGQEHPPNPADPAVASAASRADPSGTIRYDAAKGKSQANLDLNRKAFMLGIEPDRIKSLPERVKETFANEIDLFRLQLYVRGICRTGREVIERVVLNNVDMFQMLKNPYLPLITYPILRDVDNSRGWSFRRWSCQPMKYPEPIIHDLCKERLDYNLPFLDDNVHLNSFVQVFDTTNRSAEEIVESVLNAEDIYMYAKMTVAAYEFFKTPLELIHDSKGSS